MVTVKPVRWRPAAAAGRSAKLTDADRGGAPCLLLHVLLQGQAGHPVHAPRRPGARQGGVLGPGLGRPRSTPTTLSSTASTWSALVKLGLFTLVGATAATRAGTPTQRASLRRPGRHPCAARRPCAAGGPPRGQVRQAEQRRRAPGHRRRRHRRTGAGIGQRAPAAGEPADEASDERHDEDPRQRPPHGTPPVLRPCPWASPLLLRAQPAPTPPLRAGRWRVACPTGDNVVPGRDHTGRPRRDFRPGSPPPLPAPRKARYSGTRNPRVLTSAKEARFK